ncbi:MAG TPA: metallophosphoesterase, partial [Bacteroidales bacterium]|nr:metallophosphoesterase [Bacteroidales bacterium]
MLAKQIVIISLIFPFIEYYSFVAVKRVTRNLNRKPRLAVLITYVILSLSVIIALFLFRKWAAIEWPSVFMKTLVNLLIGVFFGKFVIAIIMFAGDIMGVITWLVKLLFSIPERIKGKPVQGNKISRSQFISVSAVAAGSLFTGSLSYGMTNRYRYKLRYVPIRIEGLPMELRKLKIIQISDIHAGSLDNPRAVKEGIEMAINAKPDIILFTGDLVNYRAEEVEPYMDTFKRLSAPLGVYSILGNHDYSDYLSWPSEEAKRKDFEQLRKHQQTLGWRLLMNENVILRHNTVDFALIGSENWSVRHRFTKYGDLQKSMTGIESAGLPLKIL